MILLEVLTISIMIGGALWLFGVDGEKIIGFYTGVLVTVGFWIAFGLQIQKTRGVLQYQM